MSEDLLREIAEKHGISIGREDPILILHTVNQRLLEDSAAAQQQLLQSFREQLETVAHQWDDDANRRAERMLTAALSVTRDAMAKTLQEGAAAAAAAVRRELDATAQHLTARVRGVHRVAQLNLGAAALTLAAVALLCWRAL